jgi:hypothetical protein
MGQIARRTPFHRMARWGLLGAGCIAALGAIGCVAPVESSDMEQVGSQLSIQPADPISVADPSPSETGIPAVGRKPKNCSGTLGCQFAACYDGCIRNSNVLYCSDYCECRVYDGKSDMQCQMENRYIDIAW